MAGRYSAGHRRGEPAPDGHGTARSRGDHGHGLLQRAPRQHGLSPGPAPALACARPPVRDDGTARRLHDAGPHGPACRQVDSVRHPAPVVVEARAHVFARRPPRLPPPRLRAELAPSAYDVAEPSREASPCASPAPRVCRPWRRPRPRRAPRSRGSRRGQAVPETRQARPGRAARGRQGPPAAGASAPDDHGVRGAGSRRAVSAWLRSLTAGVVHPQRATRRPCGALGASSVAPARGRRARAASGIHQACRARRWRPPLGLDRVAAPHQRCRLLLPRLARPPRGRALGGLRLESWARPSPHRSRPATRPACPRGARAAAPRRAPRPAARPAPPPARRARRPRGHRAARTTRPCPGREARPRTRGRVWHTLPIHFEAMLGQIDEPILLDARCGIQGTFPVAVIRQRGLGHFDDEAGASGTTRFVGWRVKDHNGDIRLRLGGQGRMWRAMRRGALTLGSGDDRLRDLKYVVSKAIKFERRQWPA